MTSALLRPPPLEAGAHRPLPVVVRRLTLTDFRSYRHARLDLGPAPVVLIGPNGAGKTNLLEAISLLAPGRGLRGARLDEIDRDGGGPFGVAARVDPGGGTVLEVGTGRDGESGRERRLVRIDGTARGQTDLAEVMRVVWLVPAMDQLFQEAAAARRRFLDRLVLVGEPAHAAAAARYQHAVRERLRLLRTGRRDPTWLEVLEQRAAASGVAVAAARRRAIFELERMLEAEGDTAFPRPSLGLRGEVEGWLDELPALDVESRFAARLAGNRMADAEAGMTTLGPHRSDLEVSDAASGRPARLCSTGQQKALLVSIVLAEARLRARDGGRLPVLLLDEVAAHLDPGRRAELFREIRALGAQAWLTGTDAADFEGLEGRAQFFAIHDGDVRPVGAA
ncbi:MAG: DNA replication/repair protein RecF [Geminicoccaceae bacterium]|nr:DNA replication/repair protein RecF [Geminicoccaceae bacterium]